MIEESLNNLNPLETFNPDVFVADKDYDQDLCNFILALSLVWNDMKDLMIYFEYMRSLEPVKIEIKKPEDMPIDCKWGEISGTKMHIEKLLVSLLHELVKLIRDSKGVIDSMCFKKIYKQLHKDSRLAWDTVLKFAYDEADSKSDLGRALIMVRNKITNHYDKNELFKGYKRKFIGTKEKPYISRGNNMLSHRFYFADATAQQYARSHMDKISPEEFYINVDLIKNNLNFAIKDIVETFIQRRSAWRKI